MFRFILLIFAITSVVNAQTPLGTEFTYQGNLKFNNASANGIFDFEFALYDTLNNGTGNNNGIATIEDVMVIDGIFTTQIDFGSSVFLGDNVWMEINVRPGVEVGAFQKLLPRQQITSTPYAIHAQFVGLNAIGSDEIQDGSVTANELEAGSVGINHIITSEVQQRVFDSCPAENFMTSINEDGSINCAADQTSNGGGLTVVTSNDIVDGTIATVDLANDAITTIKIADNTITSTKIVAQAVGTNEIKSYQVQRRVDSCSAGEYINTINEDGSVVCETDQTGSGGGLTTVTSNDIVDGTIATVDLGNDVITTAKVADNTITSAKIVAQAVGTNEIKSYQVQRRVTASCDSGLYLSAINEDGSVQCNPLPLGLSFTVDSIGDVGDYSSIAIRPATGLPIISYFDGTNLQLKVYDCSNSICSTGTVRILETGNTGYDPSITVRPSGFPIISYRSTFDNALKVYDCSNANCSAGTARILDDTGFMGWDSDIAIRASGFPIISYLEAGLDDLRVYDCFDTGCATGIVRTLDSAGLVGQHTSIAIRPSGFPIISYYDQSTGDLKAYDCSNVSCSSGTARTLTTTGFDGKNTSIAIQPSGNPIISFYDESNDYIKVYVCSDTNCLTGVSRTIDSTIGAGKHATSIAVNPVTGLPIISYFVNELRVFACAEETCSLGNIRILDDIASPANYVSIAIGSNGNPIISYKEIQDENLKVYSCGNSYCR